MMTHLARSIGPSRPLPPPCVADAVSARRSLGSGRNYALHARSVERVIRAMLQRLEPPMSNDEMAEIACLSACHFNRVFHKMTGIPPIQFHYALRLQHAKQLLIHTDLCITEICFEVGYQSLGTFVSRFNELVGLPPNAFRRFARQLAAVELSELRSLLTAPRDVRSSQRDRITGTIVASEAFDGIVFAGLFPRGIPEGRPVACALIADGSTYSISLPRSGNWYVFSVAVPWTSASTDLLMLDGLSRGRSGSICWQEGRCAGDSTLRLEPPHLFDPPILATLPLLLGTHVAADDPSAPLRGDARHAADVARQALALHA